MYIGNGLRERRAEERKEEEKRRHRQLQREQEEDEEENDRGEKEKEDDEEGEVVDGSTSGIGFCETEAADKDGNEEEVEPKGEEEHKRE